MTGLEFANAVRDRARLYGTLAVSGSPHFFDATLGLGIDFIFIDTEHIAYNDETLAWMCRAYRAAGIAPVVRILSPDPYLATRAIDSGAQGILAPYVEEVDDVVALVGAVKTRPLKGVLLREALAGGMRDERLADYITRYNRDRVLFVNVESPTAVSRLDELMGVSGVDGIIVGPHDLSVSSGMPEAYTSAAYRDLVGSVLGRARSAGLSAGCHSGFAGALEEQIRWVRAGANLVLHGADVIFYREQAARDLAAIRDAVGDANPDVPTGAEPL